MRSEIVEILYCLLTERHAERTVTEMVLQTGRPEAEVREALSELCLVEKAVGISAEGFVSDVAWKRIIDTAKRTLTNYHKRNPYKRRVPDSELRPALAKAAIVSDYLALKNVLEKNGIWKQERGGARLPDFSIILPLRWENAAQEMLPVFVAGGLNDPPWPGNFRANYPRDVLVDVILDALSERGELVRLSDDLYVAVESVNAAKAILQRLDATGTPITVGAVRDATGSSRRVVVPLLELLDKQGFTTRQEETRTLAFRNDMPVELPDR